MSPTRFRSVDSLKFAGVLAIVVADLGAQLAHLGYTGSWPKALNAGTELLFVLAGFTSFVMTSGRPPRPLVFFVSRVTRIAPLYWLLTLGIVLIALVAPGLMPRTAIRLDHTVATFLFLPALHPVFTHQPYPLILQAWTLNTGMMLFALFALMLPLREDRRALVALAVLTLSSCLRPLLPNTAIAGRFYTESITMTFGYGLLIGQFAVGQARLSWQAGAAAALSGLAVVIGLYPVLGPQTPNALVPGLPVAAIVFGAVACEKAGWRFVRLPAGSLARASFAIYLSHAIVLSALARIAGRLLPHAPGTFVLFGLAAVIAACLCGLALERMVERPLRAILARLAQPDAPAASAKASAI